MMSLDALFFQTPFGIALIGVWGLMVGSFLNVVIYRLPVMMEREDKMYAWEILHGETEGGDNNPFKITETFNLMFPGSHCPNCGTHIRFWQNIPIVSYLLQLGRCVSCGTKIHPLFIGGIAVRRAEYSGCATLPRSMATDFCPAVDMGTARHDFH